jgi:hypothetical protein
VRIKAVLAIECAKNHVQLIEIVGAGAVPGENGGSCAESERCCLFQTQRWPPTSIGVNLCAVEWH